MLFKLFLVLLLNFVSCQLNYSEEEIEVDEDNPINFVSKKINDKLWDDSIRNKIFLVLLLIILVFGVIYYCIDLFRPNDSESKNKNDKKKE